jgi:hypothetical protein
VSTDALSLLDGAAEVLRALAPTLPGEGRYAALLSASAVATARRDLALSERIAAARAALPEGSAAIRAGRHDGDAVLYAKLLAHTSLRAWVADPASAPEPRSVRSPEEVA